MSYRYLFSGFVNTVIITAVSVFIAGHPVKAAAQIVDLELKRKAIEANIGNYDIRLMGRHQLNQLLAEESQRLGFNVLERAGQLVAEMSNASKSMDGKTNIESSSLFGGAEVVQLRGQQTGKPSGSLESIAQSFLDSNRGLYGLSKSQVSDLQLIGVSDPGKGIPTVNFKQYIAGIPVFQSNTRVVMDKNRNPVRSIGRLVAGLDPAFMPDQQALLTPAEAVSTALEVTGVKVLADKFTETEEKNGWLRHLYSSDEITAPLYSRKVWFPLAPGVVRLAWEQGVSTSGHADWLLVTDADTGITLYRKNARSHVSTEDAEFSVYVRADGVTPADSPAPGQPNTLTPGSGPDNQSPEIPRTNVSMFAVQDLGASPNGWIDDGGETTTGNNVDAYLDTDADNAPDAGLLTNGRPRGNTYLGNRRGFGGNVEANYNFDPAPNPDGSADGVNPNAGDSFSTDPFRRGAVTNLFYVTNWFHDQLYNYGFDEASGNFQTDNFGNGGVGGDAVIAHAHDGGGVIPNVNNANFLTQPDGMLGRMQMFIFPGPNPDRDGALDNAIVIHELAHGVSNRLVGDATGLFWNPARGMGEGWSDYYALALLYSQPGDNPDGAYASGAYATYGIGNGVFNDNYLYGIRRFPYTTNNAINPLTWADVDDVTADMSGGISPSPLGFEGAGAAEVHNSGEVWAISLWEMRSRIIAANAGNVVTGNNIATQIVTDGLKLTPLDPSFTQARDALLDADCAANACANEESIWGGFADRGLGHGSQTSIGITDHISVRESFLMPDLDQAAAPTIIDTSANGNSNGFIDPGEVFELTVPLNNPWRSAAKTATGITATLTAVTPGVTILDNMAAYPDISAQSTQGSLDSFRIDTLATIACGTVIEFDLTINSSLGMVTRRIAVRAGDNTGTGTPVTFTSSPGIAIPDDTDAGALDSVNVPNDIVIADLDVRVDDLDHTWMGDVSFLVRSPVGIGMDLFARLAGDAFGGCGFGNNNEDNMTNVVFDDEAVADLMLADCNPPIPAEHTGSWFPPFNSPGLAPRVDPVPQLSRFDGVNAQGDWHVFATDRVQGDTGTLNQWSLIITPVAYSCSLPEGVFSDEFE